MQAPKIKSCHSSTLNVTLCSVMKSSTTNGHDPAELGELELSMMQLIWQQAATNGAISAEQVREELGRPLKDSTIRTVLRRLEEKGYLTHTVEGRTFIYRPSDEPQNVAVRAVKGIID